MTELDFELALKEEIIAKMNEENRLEALEEFAEKTAEDLG
jgi:hypothetical protein